MRPEYKPKEIDKRKQRESQDNKDMKDSEQMSSGANSDAGNQSLTESSEEFVDLEEMGSDNQSSRTGTRTYEENENNIERRDRMPMKKHRNEGQAPSGTAQE